MEKITIRPRTIQNIILLIVYGFILSFLIISDLYDHALNGLSSSSYLFWIAIVFLSVCIAIFSMTLILELPNIVLDRNGMTIVGLRKNLFWKWTDVGPFSIAIQRVSRTTTIWLVAFSDTSHDLLDAHDKEQIPTIETADIAFPLGPFSVGSSEQESWKFADELNQWRERYGAPENPVKSEDTKDQLETLSKKLRRKTILHIVMMILLAVMIPIVLSSILQ